MLSRCPESGPRGKVFLLRHVRNAPRTDFFFFCFFILACSLSRLCRRAFWTGFPVNYPREAARCRLPFAFRPGLSYSSSSADAMKEGVWRNSGSLPLAPSSSVSALLLLSLLFPLPALPALPFSHSGAPLPAASSAGTSLPTSAVERNSGTAWLHLPSARRSRILHRHILLPLSFSTSTHRIFCWHFHSGHSLR